MSLVPWLHVCMYVKHGCMCACQSHHQQISTHQLILPPCLPVLLPTAYHLYVAMLQPHTYVPNPHVLKLCLGYFFAYI